eukprot:CAMPEP_0185393062 /NCGR_PEP_ID=MMETSP1364-20130426/77739_1 /TAXON_ID=38817 /ORGANISM="Gephyrocapsa oceanica, Strain RCC1303" /LENGTH=91 /DNA_ID=CAMNT_0027995127 /DNA_START=101 /DNA_END=374 /DNA_ORIENTATION=-
MKDIDMWQIGGETWTWTRTGGGKSYIKEAQAMMEDAAEVVSLFEAVLWDPVLPDSAIRLPCAIAKYITTHGVGCGVDHVLQPAVVGKAGLV